MKIMMNNIIYIHAIVLLFRTYLFIFSRFLIEKILSVSLYIYIRINICVSVLVDIHHSLFRVYEVIGFFRTYCANIIPQQQSIAVVVVCFLNIIKSYSLSLHIFLYCCYLVNFSSYFFMLNSLFSSCRYTISLIYFIYVCDFFLHCILLFVYRHVLLLACFYLQDIN
jgi:hypothetical protein